MKGNYIEEDKPNPTFEYAIQHLHMAFGDTYRNNDMIELANRALALFPGVGKYKKRQFDAYSSAGRFKEYFQLAKRSQKLHSYNNHLMLRE